MPSAMDVFDPMPASTITISVSGSSSATAIPIPATSPGSLTVRVYNSGAQTVFIKFGIGGSISASTTADMPVPSGNTETFSIGSSDHIAAITASSTATLYVTPGRGA